jgi:hypothetical protein
VSLQGFIVAELRCLDSWIILEKIEFVYTAGLIFPRTTAILGLKQAVKSPPITTGGLFYCDELH